MDSEIKQMCQHKITTVMLRGIQIQKKGDLHHSVNFARLVPSSTTGETAMLIYEDLVELARMCARNARITTSRDVADELWRMAKEYQAQAAGSRLCS